MNHYLVLLLLITLVNVGWSQSAVVDNDLPLGNVFAVYTVKKRPIRQDKVVFVSSDFTSRNEFANTVEPLFVSQGFKVQYKQSTDRPFTRLLLGDRSWSLRGIIRETFARRWLQARGFNTIRSTLPPPQETINYAQPDFFRFPIRRSEFCST